MQKKTFNQFRELVYERCGINLHEGKEALLCARLAKRMRALGISSYEEYFKFVCNDESSDEIIRMIDAVSTNVTSFFRENKHFEFLGQELDKLLKNGAGRLRIWSAACSSGEEPYSISIALNEALIDIKNVDIKILATDISTRVLERAKEGVYKKDKVQPVPALWRDKYFDYYKENDETLYRVKPIVKHSIVFSRINLSTPPFPMQGPFDVIFCRNVMIYFDNEVRRKLLAEMYRLLRPGGYLMVGHAESLTGMVSDFKNVKPSIYTKH